jgi:nucleoside-diphosphate-sugar epimerase
MKNVLVSGGGGFLGSAIVRQLVDKGCTVTVAGRNRYTHIEQLGVECLVGDIGDRDFCDRLCRDVDTVFHTAAKAGIWGGWPAYKRTNVDGTVNFVDCCRKHGVPVLVYTSTPSVVFEKQSIDGGDETLDYARTFLCNYSRSKVLAERYVLKNCDNSMRSCAIRPHLIWGPGDPHLIPRLVERGRSGRLKIVGDGTNLVDITYVDNAAAAHILAAEKLHRGSECSGQAYFIGQERPVRLWDWVNELYQELGIDPISRKIQLPAAYTAGWVLEKLYRLPGIEREPQMTRFLALQLGCSHYFSHEKARRELGYIPSISIEEGKKKLIEWLLR